MELVALTREQQEFSRRIVIGGIALIVLLYVGWRIWAIQQVSLATHHAAATHAADDAHAANDAHASDDSHTANNAHADSEAHAAGDHGVHLPPPAFYSIIPFGLLLLAIALLPLFHATEPWWERNWNRFAVAVSLGAATLLYYVFVYGHGVVDHSTHQLSQAGWPAAVAVLKNALLVEYIPFITLLFSLYVISGGVAIEGWLVGRPRLNVGIMAIGGLLASLIGTTGAAMLLIRPLLRANEKRKYVAHTVVFFIFVVCNTGGCLLPIGDPPLFLGYLRGVSFSWTLSLWPMWLFMNLLLLAIYIVWDTIRYRSEDQDAIEEPPAEIKPFAIRGKLNFIWLVGVIGCVALLDPSKSFPGTHWHAPVYFRELAMLGLTALSLWSTVPEIRRANVFNYDAILEVAALFIGIFICMQAPIQLLNTYGPSLGVDQPWKFYWGTGLLSSFLDNAPTYVVFFETAKSMGSDGETMAGVSVKALAAISLGAVFMGAMTYIGNGPNFMVKAIAEKSNVRMPSFFGYMLYSCAVLLPLSVVLTLLFV